MIVGLTGGIGSGKTTVLEQFKQLGNIAVYNADVQAKNLMNSSQVIREKIITEFGPKSYQNKVLNNVYLSKIVFSNKDKLQSLNTIVHPEVYKDLKSFISIHKNKEYIVYENAILFENNSDSMCNYIITVIADKELRVKRVMERESVSRETVLARMNNQWKQTKKVLQSNYIIRNYELSKTILQIERIHNKLTKKRS